MLILLTPLYQHLREHPLSEEDVIRLGIDLCRALEICQKYNIIHRDIKPENIFYSEQGSFKLGDFGIARQLEAVEGRFEELSIRITLPEVIADTSLFTRLMREHSELSELNDIAVAYRKLLDDIEGTRELLEDPDMAELAREELSDGKKRLEDLENQIRILLIPKDPNDEKNVIFEIRAGAGGDEAALFAAEVYRMYVHYAEGRGWKVETLDFEEIGIGGMKYVNFMITGRGAWSRLKYESGVHRVQRVPATESGGRIHTSTITVAVMAEVDEDIQIDIPDKDVRIDVMRASGNGGQCVNTTDSAVRLTHYPTGIVIYSQTEKSQLQNKAKAWALLRSKLYDLEMQRRHDEEADLRRSQIGTGDRSEKIRTYNFPQGRCTDHRIKLTLYRLDDIMNGDLDEIIDSLTAADQAAKLLKMEPY